MKPNSKKTYQTNKELKIKTVQILNPQEAKTHSSFSRPVTSNLVKVRLDLKDLPNEDAADTMRSDNELKPAPSHGTTLYDGTAGSWVNLRNKNKASTLLNLQVEPLTTQNLNSDLEPYMTWKDVQLQK